MDFGMHSVADSAQTEPGLHALRDGDPVVRTPGL